MSEKLFNKEIEVFSKAMQKRLIEKQDEKGDSWKNAPLWELWEILSYKSEQMLEDIDSYSIDDDIKHLVDLANQCMLIYLRLCEWKEDI